MRYTFLKRTVNVLCQPIVISFFLFVIFLVPSAKKHTIFPANKIVKRIVSLSPSITRQVIDLGKEELLVGVTSFHPPLNKKVEIVGTLTNPNIERIVGLKPDMIVSSKEDSRVQHIEIFEQINIRIHLFDHNDSFDTICNNYMQLGRLLNVPGIAESKIKSYQNRMQSAVSNPSVKLRACVLLSAQPLIAVSNNSFIGKMLQDAGADNCTGGLSRPYPLISYEYLISANPDVIVLITKSGNSSQFFADTLRHQFKELKVNKMNSIYTLDPDFICYYTPRDYVRAVQQIVKIIEKENQKYEK